MTVAGDLVLEGQRAAEELMVDTCAIAPVTRAYNAGSDSYVDTPGVARYTGACRVKPQDAAREVEAGSETVSLWPYVVSVSMSVTTVEVDDVVTITASALDPGLVGAVMRVRSVTQGSHVTARRLGCERIA
jgi:hypothetical protein